MNLNKGLKGLESDTRPNCKCLHESDIKRTYRTRNAGFTLIETLIVVLVLGVLCATGVSMYAGATGDSQLRALSDEVNSFFTACRHRALLRKTPVKVIFQNNTLSIEQSNSLRLRIPELSEKSAAKLNGMTIFSSSARDVSGKTFSRIDLQVILPGNRPATISMEL